MSYLSVIIPAYNEAPAIRAGKLAQVARWLASQAMPYELIVVDDGSQDQTAKLAEKITDHVLRIRHGDKAAAIVAGIQKARGEVLLITDMDLATPITEACKLLAAVGRSAEVVIGSRGLVRPGAPFGRYVLSWGHACLRGAILGFVIADTQCGFKAVTREAAMHILKHLHIYHPHHLCAQRGPSVTSGFDVEFLFVAHRLGYCIREVPVEWSYQETRGADLVRDAWRGFKDLGHILVEDWKGGYPKRSRTISSTARALPGSASGGPARRR